MNAASDRSVNENLVAHPATEMTRELRERSSVPEQLAQCSEIDVVAMYLAERIDLRHRPQSERSGNRLLVMCVEHDGIVVLFRYGVGVFFNVSTDATESFLREIAGNLNRPYQVPATERVKLQKDPHQDEAISGETIYLRQFDTERLQLVATVLSKSVVFDEYEARVSENFDRVEPFVAELRWHGRGGRKMGALVRHIGDVLQTEHKMVGRVEVEEKPDLLWEHPGLEPLFLRLEDEFEIRERYAALERKLALTSRTVSTVLTLLENRRTLRVEWYIVILILLEIFLTLYELFWHTPK